MKESREREKNIRMGKSFFLQLPRAASLSLSRLDMFIIRWRRRWGKIEFTFYNWKIDRCWAKTIFIGVRLIEHSRARLNGMRSEFSQNKKQQKSFNGILPLPLYWWMNRSSRTTKLLSRTSPEIPISIKQIFAHSLGFWEFIGGEKVKRFVRELNQTDSETKSIQDRAGFSSLKINLPFHTQEHKIK